MLNRSFVHIFFVHIFASGSRRNYRHIVLLSLRMRMTRDTTDFFRYWPFFLATLPMLSSTIQCTYGRYPERNSTEGVPKRHARTRRITVNPNNSSKESPSSPSAESYSDSNYTMSNHEWQQRLSPKRYHVLREAGTEPAFSGKLLNEKRLGVFKCAACGLPLYHSETKFDSGSGWPSYTEALADAVTEVSDNSHGMQRVEIQCHRCGSHLGHVFEDGPAPTGRRHCVNSLSLTFEAKP